MLRLLSVNFLLFAAIATQPAFAKASHDDILGEWRIMDDFYGQERAVGRMSKDKKGNYVMRIVKNNLNMPNPMTKCHSKCPKPFKGKKIINLPIIWNLKPVKGKPHKYKSAYGLDPYEGVMFRGSVSLSKNKNTLKIRATPLEVTFVGKTFVFIRKK